MYFWGVGLLRVVFPVNNSESRIFRISRINFNFFGLNLRVIYKCNKEKNNAAARRRGLFRVFLPNKDGILCE